MNPTGNKILGLGCPPSLFFPSEILPSLTHTMSVYFSFIEKDEIKQILLLKLY